MRQNKSFFICDKNSGLQTLPYAQKCYLHLKMDEDIPDVGEHTQDLQVVGLTETPSGIPGMKDWEGHFYVMQDSPVPESFKAQGVRRIECEIPAGTKFYMTASMREFVPLKFVVKVEV